MPALQLDDSVAEDGRRGVKLEARCDPFRVWIEDVETGLDDPNHIRAHFRIHDTGAKGMSRRLEQRLMGIATIMAEAVNREMAE